MRDNPSPLPFGRYDLRPPQDADVMGDFDDCLTNGIRNLAYRLFSPKEAHGDPQSTGLGERRRSFGALVVVTEGFHLGVASRAGSQ